MTNWPKRRSRRYLAMSKALFLVELMRDTRGVPHMYAQNKLGAICRVSRT